MRQAVRLMKPAKQGSISPVKRAFKAAFPLTLPVMTGYLFLGTAYGIIMASKGYGPIWTFLMSLLVFAGSAQYVAITFLTAAFDPVRALLLTLLVNARHIFYGIAMLDSYRTVNRFKPYLIFGLTDETFSIVCSKEPPEGVNHEWFYFLVTLLDHGYWVTGSLIGAFLGTAIPFNARGLDFALTALFVVIFIGQWKSRRDHAPAIIGVGLTVASLMLLGPDRFIIPAMAAIVIVLTVFRKRIDGAVM